MANFVRFSSISVEPDIRENFSWCDLIDRVECPAAVGAYTLSLYVAIFEQRNV